ARYLMQLNERDQAAAILHVAWRRAPGDFWVNLELAMSSWTPSYSKRPSLEGEIVRSGEAVQFATAAVAIRPGSSVAHTTLGLALKTSGDRSGALAEFRESIRLQPSDYRAHHGIAAILLLSGDLDVALGEAREACRLNPHYALGHQIIADTLHLKG